MQKQFYALRFFFIAVLLSAGFGNAVHAQTIDISHYNWTTGGDGSTASKGDLMMYTITTTNTTTANMTNSTVTGIVPAGTSYSPGSTKVNGVSVSDINGKMPFAGSGGLINSSSLGAGVVAPNASVVVTFSAMVGANAGTLADYATLQATTSSGAVSKQSITITTNIISDPSCNQIFQSTATVAPFGGMNGYPFKIIKLMNTTNGTGGTTLFSYTNTACYNALTGAQLTAGTVLTDAEAMAYDPTTYRVYFINGTSNNPAQDLCYIDQYYGSSYTPAALRYVGYPLETNTGTGYNIDRMTFGADGYGYALTENALDLVRFSVDPSTNIPTITSLGALINDANNGSNNVLAETGGDLFADGAGKIYLIPNSGKIYRIDPATSIATYVGAISGLPSSGTNSVATDAAGYIYVSGAYQSVFRIDPTNMTAVAINSGTSNIWKNGDYTSCIVPVMTPALTMTKTWADVSGNPPANWVPAGDPVEYTLTISNTGNLAATITKLYDAIPTYAHYKANTTTMNGVAVADINGAMPFTVSGGSLINSPGEVAGIVKPGDANKVVIKFRVTTDQFRTVCNQAALTFTDAAGNILNVNSDDPSQSGNQDSTCFWSDALTCIDCRTAVTSTPNAATEPTKPIISAQVQPNPFINQLNLQVQSNTAEQVQVRLIDFYGRTVYATKEKLSAGYNSLQLNVPSLAAGIYVLELSAGNNRLLQKKLVKQ